MTRPTCPDDYAALTTDQLDRDSYQALRHIWPGAFEAVTCLMDSLEDIDREPDLSAFELPLAVLVVIYNNAVGGKAS